MIEVVSKNEQADGAFNGGEILEKRPVLMSDTGTRFKPYSNLFYWAHAWTKNGSTIGEHPHQGFEILSFVLEGSIEHYDSAHEGWKKLNAGDVQIIRAGNGISHSEKLNPGAHMFQIWFDPDIREAIREAASYNDYNADEFPVVENDGMKTITYAGEDAPLMMNSRSVLIQRVELSEGDHQLDVLPSSVNSVFVIKGDVVTGEQQLNAGDFARITSEDHLTLRSRGQSVIFRIQTPLDPGHATYAQMLLSR
jgi:redox-sensitive bicupin YhaK (pirin superfamily)